MKKVPWISIVWWGYLLLLVWRYAFQMDLIGSLQGFIMNPFHLSLSSFLQEGNLLTHTPSMEPFAQDLLSFLPLGLLLPISFQRANPFVHIFLVMLTSLLLAVLAYLVRQGNWNVLIMVTQMAGGTLGLTCYQLLAPRLKQKGPIVLVIGAVLIIFGWFWWILM